MSDLSHALNLGRDNTAVLLVDHQVGLVVGSRYPDPETLCRNSLGAKTAKAGEVIFMTAGTKVVYQAEEDNTEVVYVTYPHWSDAQRKSEHADLLKPFHPV